MNNFDMEKIIKLIKEKNGNQNFQMKDLIWYLIAQHEIIHNKLDRKADKHLVYWITGILFTMVGTIFFTIFRGLG